MSIGSTYTEGTHTSIDTVCRVDATFRNEVARKAVHVQMWIELSQVYI